MIEAHSIGGPVITGTPRHMKPAGRRCRCGNLLSRYTAGPECNACLYEIKKKAVEENETKSLAERILDELPASIAGLAEITGAHTSSVQKVLIRLMAEGKISRRGNDRGYFYTRATDGAAGAE